MMRLLTKIQMKVQIKPWSLWHWLWHSHPRAGWGEVLHSQAGPHARPSVGPSKVYVNRCNESPLRGQKPDFWPVSKFNTGSLPLRGNPAGNNVIDQRNYQSVGIGHCYCSSSSSSSSMAHSDCGWTITLSFSLVYHLGLASSSMALNYYIVDSWEQNVYFLNSCYLLSNYSLSR